MTEAGQTTMTDPGALREQMVDELIAAGAINDPRVEAAFRAVPREIFCPPGTPAEQPYLVHDKVRTRFGPDGATLSSLSAPILHARTLAQLDVEPGMRVLEIGSGGPLAMLLAHMVGPDGEVVTVDIDEGVTGRTRTGIERLGFADRVAVVTADAGLPLDRGRFDRIIVTVAARTIPQTWLDQLTDDGILVVPFKLAPNSQRVIGFRYRDGVLASETVVVGGFVPMQGRDHYAEPTAARTGPSGGSVTFRFDSEILATFAVTDAVLASTAVEAWSGVTYLTGIEWVDLLTWVLIQPGGCQITADDRADVGPGRTVFPAIVDGDSFAALTARQVSGQDRIEIGAVAKGHHAGRVAGRLIDAVRTYDDRHRDGGPTYGWIPAPMAVRNVPPHVTVLRRPHGTLLITWPASVVEDQAAQTLREHTTELDSMRPESLNAGMVPLLGEQHPDGLLLPVSSPSHVAAAEQIAAQFKRERGYDFSPYDPADRTAETLLIMSRAVATFPVAAGAVGMRHDDDHWTLTWTWMHPYERGRRGNDRDPRFAFVWDELEARYGQFHIEAPYSKAMHTFLISHGVDSSRYEPGDID